MKRFRSYIQELNLSRVFQHLQTRNVGMMSAFRSERSQKENLQATRKLASEIRSAGYAYHSIDGVYIETLDDGTKQKVKEKSFFIFSSDEGDDNGRLKGLMKQWGKKYEQETVLYKDYNESEAILIGTSPKSTSFVPYGQEKKIGKWKPQRAGDMYSAMKGGKKTFTFESIYHVTFPNTLTRGFLSREGVKLEEIDSHFLDEVDDL